MALSDDMDMTARCRCCGDSAVSEIHTGDGMTELKVYRDFDGPLCYECYHEVHHNNRRPGVRYAMRRRRY